MKYIYQLMSVSLLVCMFLIGCSSDTDSVGDFQDPDPDEGDLTQAALSDPHEAVNNAIESKDVDLCPEGEYHDICIKNIAVGLKNVDTCTLAGSEKLSCIKGVAEAIGKIEPCTYAEGLKDECIRDAAIAGKNADACIYAPDEKNACIKGVAVATLNKNHCNNAGDLKDQCLTEVEEAIEENWLKDLV